MSPSSHDTLSDQHSCESQDQNNENNNYSDIDLGTRTDFEIKSTDSHSCSECPNCDSVIQKIKSVILTTNDSVTCSSISKPEHAMCHSITRLSLGLVLLTAGLIMIALPPFHEFVQVERLKMQPGLPPFEQWVIPQPEVRLSVYIFEAENPWTFLNGTDKKLRLKEIGPIVYREHLHHKDVVFHNNSTLSYTAARRIEFLEDQNEPGIMNRTILVPNFVVLASAASVNDDFWRKIGFNSMFDEPLFLNMTIYEYLWQYRSKLVQKLYNIASFLVPTNNSGVLFQIYDNFNDRYNVRIGPEYTGDHFFEITSVNGGTVVPGFNTETTECNATVIGSTEGALYKTHLNENSVLWYWRKSLCRQVPLYFEKKLQKGSFEAFKFVLKEDVYDRNKNRSGDCYRGHFDVDLPDGLSDLSKCFYDLPFAASNPHFYGRYPNVLTEKLDGFKPDKERHQSFIIVEPTMGVPIDQSARSQNNVIIPKLYGFSKEIERFNNMALPTFWVEYHQKKLTVGIERLLYFSLFILPMFQWIIAAILIISGLLIFSIGLYQFLAHSASKRKRLNRKLAAAIPTWQSKKDLCIKA